MFTESLLLNEAISLVDIEVTFKVGLSPSKKIYYFLKLQPFKNDEKCFLFRLKALFALEIFKFLFYLFGHVEKTA